MSIFDLKTNVGELASANQGTSRMDYEQQTATRDISGNNFPNGAIYYRWETGGTKWWLPQRTYLRVRATLSKADGTQLTMNDDIAPNMDLCSNLFQSCEFRVNDKTLGRVSDFVPEVSMMDTRLNKSRSWIEGVGSSTNWLQTEQSARKAEITSDGLDESKASPQDSVLTGRAALGFDPTTTAAFTAASNTISFATGTIPDVRTLFPVGSKIAFTAAFGTQAAGDAMIVVSTPTAATLVVGTNAVGANIAAAVVDFSRVDQAAPSRRVRTFEMVWQPPLNIFKVATALPGGKYELVLNPQTSTTYQNFAVESNGANKVPGTDFTFSITDMYLYVATVEGPRVDDLTYLLDLETIRCQTDNIDNTSFQQKSFDVSPSTYALAVAYQDQRIGTDTRVSAAKFKSYNAALSASEEVKLNRFFINFAGANKPAPDADPSYQVGTAIDYTTQRYVESNIYSGGYYDTGGAENIEEWQKRGPYYYFAWPRDSADRSTRCTVHQQFDGADVANMRICLFDLSRQVARIRIQNSRIVDVQVEDA